MKLDIYTRDGWLLPMIECANGEHREYTGAEGWVMWFPQYARSLAGCACFAYDDLRQIISGGKRAKARQDGLTDLEHMEAQRVAAVVLEELRSCHNIFD